MNPIPTWPGLFWRGLFWRGLLQAGALTVLLVTPSAAQMPSINMMPELQSKTADEKERDEARDKAYRESLRKIPDSQKSNDPWGNVRGADAAPKPVAKPKPAQPKRAKADIPAN